MTLYYTTRNTLHYNTTTTTLPCTRLHYTIPHYTTRHYTALHYTNYTTLRLQLQLHLPINELHYVTATAPLHDITATAKTATTTSRHHTTSSRCGKVTTATIATIPKSTTPTTVGPSVDSLCHPWFTTTIGFLFLKVPLPPCALLLVWNSDTTITVVELVAFQSFLGICNSRKIMCIL